MSLEAIDTARSERPERRWTIPELKTAMEFIQDPKTHGFELERLFRLLAFIEGLTIPLPFLASAQDLTVRDELSFDAAMQYLAKGRRVKRKYWPEARALEVNMASLAVSVVPTLSDQGRQQMRAPYEILVEDIVECDWELLP